MANTKRQSRLASMMRDTFTDAPVPVAPDALPVLIDGTRYWLGAVWAKYNLAHDSFDLDNCFIPRANVREWYTSRE